MHQTSKVLELNFDTNCTPGSPRAPPPRSGCGHWQEQKRGLCTVILNGVWNGFSVYWRLVLHVQILWLGFSCCHFASSLLLQVLCYFPREGEPEALGMPVIGFVKSKFPHRKKKKKNYDNVEQTTWSPICHQSRVSSEGQQSLEQFSASSCTKIPLDWASEAAALLYDNWVLKSVK